MVDAQAFNLNASITSEKIEKGYFFENYNIIVNISPSQPAFIIAKIKGPKRNYNVLKQSGKFNSSEAKNVFKLNNQESFYYLYVSDLSLYRNHRNELQSYNLLLEDFLESKLNLDPANAFYNYMLEKKFYTDVPLLIDHTSNNDMYFPIKISSANSEGTYIIEIFAFDNLFNLLESEKMQFVLSDNYVYNFFTLYAAKHPFEYTCLAVFMAIILGLAAGHLKSIRKNP